MSKQAIIKIKEAEEKAEQIRAEAVNAAKAKIKDTEILCKKYCEEAEIKAADENAGKLELIREKADESITRSKENAEENAKQSVADAELHLREAVRCIIEGVMEQCQ